MAFIINTNINAINTQRHLNISTNALNRTFQRLSSGMRINSASDDAAGLGISTRMTAEIRGLSMAIRNANDGISMVQVTEGATQESVNALQRIRELAVQSANGTMTSGDRRDLQLEVNQLLSEIQRIATETQFNGISLMTGNFLVPPETEAEFDEDDDFDDDDFDDEDDEDVEFNAGIPANRRMVIQVGAKEGQAISFSIADMRLDALGGLGVNSHWILDPEDGETSIQLMEDDEVTPLIDYPPLIATRSAAESTITKIDTILDQVARQRSNLGAVQNRFSAVISNLSNVVENMSAARSRILDADIAAETAALTQLTILQQAGTAVLAQANQQPALALQLLS